MFGEAIDETVTNAKLPDRLMDVTLALISGMAAELGLPMHNISLRTGAVRNANYNETGIA